MSNEIMWRDGRCYIGGVDAADLVEAFEDRGLLRKPRSLSDEEVDQLETKKRNEAKRKRAR